MGGRLQIRWSGKAKKRRLLLRISGVLQFAQLDVGVVYYILSRLEHLPQCKAEICVLLPSWRLCCSSNDEPGWVTRGSCTPPRIISNLRISTLAIFFRPDFSQIL